MNFRNKRIKVELDKTGRNLKVLEAPKSIMNEIQNADTLKVTRGRITPVTKMPAVPLPPVKKTSLKKPAKVKAPPIPAPAPPPATDDAMATAMKEMEKPTPIAPAAATAPATPEPAKKELSKPWVLTDRDRAAARRVPVPPTGPIAPKYTPYIDWEAIPENCRISDISYDDYPTPSAPKGMLTLLRDNFKLNRMYQNKKPTNVLIVGPPGTGKTTCVRAFAEETDLPYWQVVGQDGLTSEELLGRSHIRNGQDVWEDGIIPRAIRAGGILHFDEPNVLPASVLMRLNELMDAKRQLNMQDLNGEIVKAHPDLFIVFTMNPSNYEGVGQLPPPIISRFKQVWLPFAPPEVEYKILASQLRAVGVKSSEFEMRGRGVNPTGSLSRDIVDFMKIINGLRADKQLPYHPSMRQALDFVFARKQGYDFKTAFNQTVGDSYVAIDESQYKPVMDEALNSVNRL